MHLLAVFHLFYKVNENIVSLYKSFDKSTVPLKLDLLDQCWSNGNLTKIGQSAGSILSKTFRSSRDLNFLFCAWHATPPSLLFLSIQKAAQRSFPKPAERGELAPPLQTCVPRVTAQLSGS